VGALLWPLAYLAFVLEYTGWKLKHPRRTWAILASLPLAFLLLAATERWHGILTRPTVPPVADVVFPSLLHGATSWVWVTAAYTYGIGMIGLFFLIGAYRRARPLSRAQIRTVFIGAVVPILGITLFYFGALRDIQIDLASLAFALGDLIVVWGLFRHRLPDLVPLARDRVFEGLLDGVVVLDTEQRVVDYNREAGVLLGQAGPEDDRWRLTVFDQIANIRGSLPSGNLWLLTHNLPVLFTHGEDNRMLWGDLGRIATVTFK